MKIWLLSKLYRYNKTYRRHVDTSLANMEILAMQRITQAVQSQGDELGWGLPVQPGQAKEEG